MKRASWTDGVQSASLGEAVSRRKRLPPYSAENQRRHCHRCINKRKALQLESELAFCIFVLSCFFFLFCLTQITLCFVFILCKKVWAEFQYFSSADLETCSHPPLALSPAPCGFFMSMPPTTDVLLPSHWMSPHWNDCKNQRRHQSSSCSGACLVSSKSIIQGYLNPPRAPRTRQTAVPRRNVHAEQINKQEKKQWHLAVWA